MDYKIHLVQTFQDVENFFTWLSKDREYLGMDTETEGLVYGKHKVRMFQFGDESEGWSFPHTRWSGVCDQVFREYTGNYAFWNAKFDLGRLQEDGIAPPKWHQVHDGFVMAVLHDNQEPSKKLKRMSKKFLGIDSEAGERKLHEYFRKSGTFWDTVPIDNPFYWQYAALDTSLTAMMCSKLKPLSVDVYPQAYDIEMAAIRVLMQMEANGLAIDLPYAEQTLADMEKEWDSLVYMAEKDGKEHAFLRSTDIRPNYREDILGYFTGIGIPVPVKLSKKTGKASIDDEVLSKMDHPVAKEIQTARHLTSWINNYLKKIVENQYQGRVHPHINPLGNEEKGMTGRMSITDPALSVLEKSSLIRDCIVAEEGNKLVAIDYQNEELRIIGSICNSIGMIEAFKNGEDMHKKTASIMYGIDMSQVTAEQKTNAKRAMFTKAYGGKEKTFAAYMGLGYEEGARYFHTLSLLYPELDNYIESQKQTIKANKVDGYGHIFLSDGRRLNIPAEQSFRSVSYSSQGEGAIVLKRKLVALDAAGFGEYLRLPVHDEVIMSIPQSPDFTDTVEQARQIMECHDYVIPLTCDVEIMDKWGDAYRDG